MPACDLGFSFKIISRMKSFQMLTDCILGLKEVKFCYLAKINFKDIRDLHVLKTHKHNVM